MSTEPDEWREYGGSALSAPLAAALAEFVEHGYHGTTVRDIARRAGLSVSGLYHHYPSKQELLVGLTDAAIEELIGRSRAAEAEAGPSPSARFDAVVESLLLFHMYRREQAFLSSTEIRSFDPDRRAAYVAKRDEQQRMVDRIVADGVSDNVFRVSDPVHASRAVTTMCVGVASWYRPDGPSTPADLVRIYLDIARRMVGA
ncbi:TetR/AcrR family transcriptional regulator [Rhodococcoides trifolii]|uniref:TetR/AcrR family transcriptional regulator n=1 Tax=Rhodococcoides trifolii TaxID=908250 RepID=UPI001E322DC3|nr:TetR/AcrR family transcriptional regulator [Rhodococcus trifolii]